MNGNVQYSGWDCVQIFAEALANVENGQRKLREGNLDHAALCFEVAASKCRTLSSDAVQGRPAYGLGGNGK